MLTTALVLLLLLGSAAGALANDWLQRNRTQWAPFARWLVAATAFPLLILLLFCGYAALIFAESQASGMDELASRAVLVLGLGAAGAAVIGGLIGSSLRGRKQR